MNCCQDAALLFSMKNKIQENINVWAKFLSYLLELSPYLQVEQYNYLPNTTDKIQPHDFPLVTCVVDSKGQDDHCITIHKCWIYNSNFSNALPLHRMSLDLCCSGDQNKLTFNGTRNCYRFPRFDNYLKQNQNKDKKMHENEKRNAKNKQKQLAKQEQKKKQKKV